MSHHVEVNVRLRLNAEDVRQVFGDTTPAAPEAIAAALRQHLHGNLLMPASEHPYRGVPMSMPGYAARVEVTAVEVHEAW